MQVLESDGSGRVLLGFWSTRSHRPVNDPGAPGLLRATIGRGAVIVDPFKVQDLNYSYGATCGRGQSENWYLGARCVLRPSWFGQP